MFIFSDLLSCVFIHFFNVCGEKIKFLIHTSILLAVSFVGNIYYV